jgi:hypothetical protein
VNHLSYFQSNAFELIALTVLHAIAIAVPMFAAATWAFKKGVTDPMLLMGVAACSSGLYAYFMLWVWMASPSAGFIVGIVGLATLLWLAIRSSTTPANTFRLTFWSPAFFIWLFYSLFILSVGLATGDFHKPLSVASERFTHALPIDNQLPYIFAKQVAEGNITSPMIAGWLGSDRPPLQSAYFLGSGTARLGNSALHYQIVGVLLQCLWVVGLFALLKARRINTKITALVLAVSMFCGLSVVHGFYVWPKLLPVLFLVIVFDVAFRSRTFTHKKLAASILGLSAGLAMLCHGGSVFPLIGLGLALLILRKSPTIPMVLVSASLFLALSATWSAYQKFADPPGDRLMKWHLAGVIAIDDRPFLQTLKDSYGRLKPHHIVRLKYSNFQTMTGNPSGWIPQTLLSSIGQINDDSMGYLRAEQFFGVLPSLGLLSVGLFALPFPRRPGTTNESELSSQFLIVALLSIASWGLLLFGPRYTVVHAGSLANILFLYAGITLLTASRSMLGGAGLVALSISSFGFIYLSTGWSRGAEPTDSGLILAAVASLGIVAASLLSIARSNHLSADLAS